jgi:hypothetical protein
MMRVFYSRWRALIWSAGVVFLALQFAWPPSRGAAGDANAAANDDVVITDALGQPVNEQEVRDLASALDGSDGNSN